MALKDQLETRAAQCKSAADFVALAKQALADPADAAYAAELLTKAEMQSQFPADYIITAEAFARDLNDTAHAKELFEQAEEACFEASELAAVGHSVAVTLGDKDKARELLEKAAADARDIQTIMLLAKYASEDVQDADLAKQFTGRVESQLKTLADYRKVAAMLVQSDPETAKTLYKKAARLASGIPGTVEYAQGILQLFKDEGWAGQTLADLETDCQFTKDFVQLADAYKGVLNDASKARELLQQGEDLAMTAEEHVEQAKGWIQVVGDQAAADAAFERALKETSNGPELMALAKTIVSAGGSRELAKQAYAKAEAKLTTGSDTIKLARAIMDDLQDKELASRVYAKAEGVLSAPADLMGVGGEVLTRLGDQERARAIYKKAQAAIAEFPLMLQLINEVLEKLGDKDYAKDLVADVERFEPGTNELLPLAERAIATLGDTALAGQLLKSAEDRVTSLEDMRKVAAAVKQHFPNDKKWVKQVDDKVAKREANQDKYNELQAREQQATSLKLYLQLVHEVMAQLDDVYYARKLLASAEELLGKDTYNFYKYRDLAVAVARYVKDAEWVQRLFDTAAGQCQNFSCMQEVARSASRDLTDRELGRRLARKYLEAWGERLAASQPTAYDYGKLAALAVEELKDAQWAKELLSKGDALAQEPLVAAHLASVAVRLGDPAEGQRLYTRAAELCKTPDDCKRLAHWVASAGDTALARDLYGKGQQQMKSPMDRLHWAEGIVELFHDDVWARQAYDELAQQFTAVREREIYETSRKYRLERALH